MDDKLKPEDTDFKDVEEVDSKVKEAMDAALEKHRRMGNPFPQWDGHNVRLIPAEELPKPKRQS